MLLVFRIFRYLRIIRFSGLTRKKVGKIVVGDHDKANGLDLN